MQLGKYSVSVDLKFGSSLFLIVLRRTWGERSRSKKFYGSNWVLIKLLDCCCSKPFHKCHIEEWYTSVHKRHTSKLQPSHFLKGSWESRLVWNTLISHYFRYTLLLLSWSPFWHQKYISCSCSSSVSDSTMRRKHCPEILVDADMLASHSHCRCLSCRQRSGDSWGHWSTMNSLSSLR